jgi:transcriptional regulator with XRE-family HTH domain
VPRDTSPPPLHWMTQPIQQLIHARRLKLSLSVHEVAARSRRDDDNLSVSHTLVARWERDGLTRRPPAGSVTALARGLDLDERTVRRAVEESILPATDEPSGERRDDGSSQWEDFYFRARGQGPAVYDATVWLLDKVLSSRPTPPRPADAARVLWVMERLLGGDAAPPIPRLGAVSREPGAVDAAAFRLFLADASREPALREVMHGVLAEAADPRGDAPAEPQPALQPARSRSAGR